MNFKWAFLMIPDESKTSVSHFFNPNQLNMMRIQLNIVKGDFEAKSFLEWPPELWKINDFSEQAHLKLELSVISPEAAMIN